MPLPHYGQRIEYVLNEEKYTNEKRRLILRNLSDEIDFIQLEDMKTDFMEIDYSRFEPKYFKTSR